MIKRCLQNGPELVSRLTLGLVFAISGWDKFQSLEKVSMYFESLGIPWAHLQAPFVSGIELIAGVFLILGFFTRLSSLPLIAIMIVAIRTAKWEDVTDFTSLLGFSEFLYIVILLWLVAYGSKFFSIDSFIQKARTRKSSKGQTEGDS